MVCVTSFKGSFTDSFIQFRFIFFVMAAYFEQYKLFSVRQAPLIEQFSFFTQLHNFVFGGDVFSNIFLFVMFIDFRAQVWQAEFFWQSVFIKNFVKLVGQWKIFVEKDEKVFTQVHLQRFAEGWVTPYNIQFSVFSSVFIIFSLLLVKYFLVISTVGKTLLIIWCQLVKYIF